MPKKSTSETVVPLEPIGQRRYLTLLFSDLTGSTSLGEQMEAEEYAAMIEALRSVCREVIPRRGGRIARLQGDGVLALFGHPQAREDDGRRATEVALELHSAVRGLPFGPDGSPLTMHSGVHSGLVLVSDGDLELGRFELTGSAPNIAARLSALAGPDEVLVSEETLGPQRRFFRTGAITPVRVKGRAAVLPLVQVLSTVEASGRGEVVSEARLETLLGRDAPLEILRRHVAEAVRGSPQCIVLYGGPGMGKSRLIEEFLRDPSLARCLVLRGFCENAFNAEPLQPFAQVARSLLADDDVEPGLFEACNQALAGGTSGIRALFDLLSSRGPVVLVIDDWHWADEASQLALDAVMSIRRPIGVVLASRMLPDSLGSVTTGIELLPLSEEEAGEQVARLQPGADPFMVAEITRYAGGNPLFIEELCHTAAAQGSPGLTNLRGSGRAWLNVLIASRVERLPAREAALVRAAAVIGNVFPNWLFERVTGHAADSPSMAVLADKDFIFGGSQPGTQRFKHGITRDAIYETVGLRERKRMHRQIALTLQAHAQDAAADELLEALAYHCALGDMPHEACRHAERAGDKAMAASAVDRARTQYAAALRALDQTAPLDLQGQLLWCAIAQKLGLACVFDPLALADGLATFERAVTLAQLSGDLMALARAQYWLGYLSYAKGLARPAISKCRAALDLALQMGDERFASQVRATLGQAMLSACEYDSALGLLDAALESRQPVRGDGKVAVGPAYTLACKGYLLGDRGHFSGAHECFAEALHVLRNVRHQVAASVRHWMSVVLLWQGRWEEAALAADEATSIALSVKSRQQLAMGQALANRARWMIDGAPMALQKVREATAWIEGQKGGLATSLNHGWIVEGALAEGRVAELRRHAALLLLRARAQDRIGEALGCRALALAASEMDDFKRATRWLQRARHSADMRGSAHERAANLLCEAQIEIRLGQGARARALLDEACAAFEPMRMAWHAERARVVRLSMESGCSSVCVPSFRQPQ